jgi:hypothetical protein
MALLWPFSDGSASRGTKVAAAQTEAAQVGLHSSTRSHLQRVATRN